MESSSPTHRYTVSSRFASTGLTCTRSVAEHIDRLARPYLTLEPGSSGPGTWQVVADTAPPDSAVPESVAAQGEVAVDYAVDHARKTFFHLAPQGEAWVTQSLLRATRAVHRSAASRQGVLFLHAGLVELNGLGVALVGGSRAGKTSFIMAGVLQGSGVMVCNDDVSLTAEQDGNGVLGAGWPRSISVRLDTLDLLFGRDRAQAVRSSLTHPANRTLLSLRESGVEEHGTALIYPWEYADLLHTKIGQSAKVDALVHLSLTDDPSEAEVASVPPSERDGLLEKHVLGLPNKHLNIFGHEPARGSLRRTRDALTALPTFRFRYEFRDVRRQVERLAHHLRARVPGPDRAPVHHLTGQASPAGPEPRQ
ncbi:hypothetical protein OG883_36225 [Streptomyces sp. NBC_01142]|uniref:hypothetical protein n=1 Tax=Streptomyces sp. NBC_01142 TaxID=2975865 RepID=UPI0022538BEB|nr:hypothetical protein [Streptomyces sp. NBC_01142]MCX4825215.1 hypothetical protein [Streptomyces sp. NBC_01142]